MVRVRERWGNSDTFSNSVDKALGCKLCGMSERQQPRAKNIAHANDGGGMDPPAPPLDPPLDVAENLQLYRVVRFFRKKIVMHDDAFNVIL